MVRCAEPLVRDVVRVGVLVCSLILVQPCALDILSKRGDDENSQVSATTSTGYLGSTRMYENLFRTAVFLDAHGISTALVALHRGRTSISSQPAPCVSPTCRCSYGRSSRRLSRKSAFSTSRHCLASRLSATFRSDISRLSFHQLLLLVGLSRMGNLLPLLNTCRTSLGKTTNL